MKADKKTLTLLGIATIFTLASGGLYAFLFYIMKDKTEATLVVSERLDDLSGKESRVVSSISTLRQESENIEKLSNYFFKENEVVAFTKKIEALGPQSGTVLTIESLEQGYTEKKAPFLNFRIRATGSFADVGRLLVLIENFPGKIEWKNVRITRDSVPANQDLVDGKVVAPVVTTPEWRMEAFLVALNFIN
ncbi:MAG: hypothetical protein Q7K40_02580 [bacterium]|nr:hypothetical protein [bacterium]